MPNPKDVFEDPFKYWGFLTTQSDNDFEGQQFDRKQAGNIDASGLVTRSSVEKLRENVQECVSAFANTNVGLLVLGIAKDGSIHGTRHLDENQQNSLTNINKLLRNQAAQIKYYECEMQNGDSNDVILVFVPHHEFGICETLENSPKAWIRNGKQNNIMSSVQREQIKRDKGIVEFEQTLCCQYQSEDIDHDILNEYKKSLNHHNDFSDVDFLYEIGAISKHNNIYMWTNAGYLFFSRNPQRTMSWAYLRLLRFDSSRDDEATRGMSTLREAI